MNEEELSSYLNWPRTGPVQWGINNENAEVHNTAGNREARTENEPPVVPAATSAKAPTTEPPPATEPPVEEPARKVRVRKPVEVPPKRPKRARRTVAGPLGLAINFENVEPLKTQFVISSDTEEEERAKEGEDLVGNNDISSCESSEDTKAVGEEYDEESIY